MLKSAPPIGWKKTALGHVAEVQTGIAKGKAINGAAVTLPYLRVANVQDGHVDLSVMKEITLKPTEVDRYSLRKGDVLFTEGGDFDKLGRGTVWNGEIELCLHQNHVFAVRPSPDRLLPEFLAFQAASQYGRRYFQMCSKQSTNLASINSTQLKQFPVLLPPLPEQRKIAEILRTWDEAIEKAERSLIVTRVIRSAEIARAIFKENNRNTIALGDLVGPVTSKVTDQRIPILTISAESGFVEQHTYFSRRIASESLHSYSILERGEFAYNRSRANGYPCGAIKRLNILDRGAVTSLYFCFKSRSENPGIADYLEVLFESGVLNPQLARIAKEGSRAHGLLNVGKEDFLNMTVHMPPQRTRASIAAMHRHAVAEIAASVKRVELLSKQKSGLMQKLLTGQIRVPEAAANLSPAAD